MSDTPPAVRILPMNRDGEFPKCRSREELQEEFFLHEFPRRPNGTYRYRKAGLIAKAGTVVLFQSDGAIIASANLNETRRFSEPDNEGYKGALYFDVRSIRVFDPVALGALQNIWPIVKSFGRVKWNLNPNGFPEFERELKGVRRP